VTRSYDYEDLLEEFKTQCPGLYLGYPVPGGYKYGDLALQVEGASRIGTIKYGLEYRRTALARTSSNSILQTRLLVREGAKNIKPTTV
jgi:hypothetical protein